jgi:Bacterial HORMA domain family 1
MSYSYTLSETFSITHARHIASRLAGDMRLMNAYYDYPSLVSIDNFLEEIAQLLAKGYLATFEIGFKGNGRRVFSLYYEVLVDGTLSDSRSGGVPAGHDVGGAAPFNYLTHSAAWFALSQSERDAFEAILPVQRTPGPEPVDGDGYWVAEDRSYASGGTGMRRRKYVPL